MIEQPAAALPSESMWRSWPCFIGGACAPFLAHMLLSWMPASVSVGLAFFIMWNLVGVLFTFSPPGRRWSFARWVGGGALGGLVAGVLAFLIHA